MGITSSLNRNADIICTVLAIVGLGTTVALTVKETPEAIDILDSYKIYKEGIKQDYANGKISKQKAVALIYEANRDVAKDLAFNYLPAGISFIATTGFIVAPTAINRVKIGTLTTSLNAATIAYNELRDKTREMVGDKKEQEIHDAIEETHTVKTCELIPVNDIYHTGCGNTLCRIELVPGLPETGILFYSSPEAVHKAINEANAEGLASGYVSLSDLLYFLNLKIRSEGVRMRGWRICSRDDFISIRESSYIHPTTGQPVLDISFWTNPYEGFDRWG